MSSWSCALWMLRDLISLISSSLKPRDESLELVSYDWISGTVLLFANIVHWESKKILKKYAFSLKSEITLFLCNNRGTKGNISLSLSLIFIYIQQT